MRYLLDSNIVISLASGTGSLALRARVAGCDEGAMATSAIVLAEVAYGSANQKPPLAEDLRSFLEEVPVLPFDAAAARVYATLPFRRASYDRLIAARALSLGLIVVTANLRDFGRIPSLRVENWTA